MRRRRAASTDGAPKDGIHPRAVRCFRRHSASTLRADIAVASAVVRSIREARPNAEIVLLGAAFSAVALRGAPEHRAPRFLTPGLRPGWKGSMLGAACTTSRRSSGMASRPMG